MSFVGSRAAFARSAAVGVAVAAVLAVVVLMVARSGEESAVAEPAPAPTAPVSGSASPEPGEAGSGVEPPETAIEPETDAPVVEPYADELSGRVHTPGAGPTPKATVKPGYDGCDHGYGEPGQCVPWEFPSAVKGAAAKCAWLKDSGFKVPLAVRGDDRHGLDPDHDGLGCEK